MATVTETDWDALADEVLGPSSNAAPADTDWDALANQLLGPDGAVQNAPQRTRGKPTTPPARPASMSQRDKLDWIIANQPEQTSVLMRQFGVSTPEELRRKMLPTADEKAQERLQEAEQAVSERWLPNVTTPLLQAGGDLASMAMRALPSEAADALADDINRLNQYEDQAMQSRDAKGVVPEIVKRGWRGALRTLPSSIVSGMAAGPYGAIGYAAASEANQAITTGKDQGLKGGKLAAYVTGHGIVEAVPAIIMQLVGAGGLEKIVGGKGTSVVGEGIREGLKQAGRDVAEELPEEIVTELSHNVVNALAGTEPLSVDQTLRTVADTTVQTLITMGLAEAPSLISSVKSVKDTERLRAIPGKLAAGEQVSRKDAEALARLGLIELNGKETAEERTAAAMDNREAIEQAVMDDLRGTTQQPETKETEGAGDIRSPETEVRQEQGGTDVRGDGAEQAEPQPTSEIPPAQPEEQGPVAPVTQDDVRAEMERAIGRGISVDKWLRSTPEGRVARGKYKESSLRRVWDAIRNRRKGGPEESAVPEETAEAPPAETAPVETQTQTAQLAFDQFQTENDRLVGEMAQYEPGSTEFGTIMDRLGSLWDQYPEYAAQMQATQEQPPESPTMPQDAAVAEQAPTPAPVQPTQQEAAQATEEAVPPVEPQPAAPPAEAPPATTPFRPILPPTPPPLDPSAVADQTAAPAGKMRTLSGRDIDPPQQKTTATDRGVKKNILAVDAWLVEQGIAEADAKGDEYNGDQFRRIDPKRITTAERDGLNLYLFGQEEVPFPKAEPAPKPKIGKPKTATKPAEPATPPVAKEPEEKPKPVEIATAESQKSPDVRLARGVADTLKVGMPIDAARFHGMAERSYGGTRAEGAYDPSRANDALELGVNIHISETSRYNPPNIANKERAKETIRDLDDLVRNKIPPQTNRSGLKDAAQQFSTPPAYAYAVNWVANIQPGEVVLEPSAGTGGLAVHAKRAGAKVYVNELKQVAGKPNLRAQLLEEIGAEKVFTEDAEQIGNVLAGKIQPTVVVMNPPFSRAADRMGAKKIQGTDLKHIDAALKLLAPNGRLVAIIGAGLHGKGKALQAWEDNLPYNLRADIELARDVYKGYGTTFPTRVLVIDKTARSGDTVTGKAETLEELLDTLEGIRNDRAAATQSQSTQPKSQGTASAGEGRTRPGDAVRSPTRPVASRPEPEGTSRTSGAETRQPDAGTRESVREPAAAEGTQDVSEPRLPKEGSPAGGRGTATSRRFADTGKSGREVGGEPVRQPVEPESAPEPRPQLDVEAVPSKPRKQELTEAIYEAYQPRRARVKGSKPHPASVVESSAMAAIDPPAVDYAPNLPAKTVESGALSDIQLEAVVYAGHAHSQSIEIEGKEYRKGFLIGDGTGIGKGRTAAGIILDNVRQGRKRAVWVSKNYGLLTDSKEYADAVGLPSDTLFSHQGTSSGVPFADADGVLFTTYETLRGTPSAKAMAEGKNKSRLDQVVEWLGENFDGAIIFDEAHLMGNAVDVKGGRGVKKASARALAGVELQRRLPKARIVYMSATAATEVNNLAYAERLGLWGKGTPFANQAEFASEITKGGVAAMEKVAADMKAMGLYVSRNISFNDGTEKGTVQYERLEHTLTPEEKASYDKMAEAWGVVFQNMSAALEMTEGATNGRAVSAARSAFWGANQRFWNQVITAFQVPEVIRGIETDLKDGRSVVIQLTNTNEAATQRALADLDEESSYDEIDTSPRGILMDFVEKSFPVWQYEEYSDDDGNIRTRPAVDSQGNRIKNAEAVALQQQLLDDLGSLQVGSRGAIDMVLDHFGTDQVSEITGRTMRLVKNKDGKLVKESRGKSQRDADIKTYQSGKKRILVFSEAGGTGASYHADVNRPNQQQRKHYLLQAGWRADTAVQGLGRTHRSNQAQAPVYVLVHTNLKGQKRFISTIARRLSQLGAITKGQRKAVAGGEDAALFTAADNLESTEARQALVKLYQDVLANAVPNVSVETMERSLGLRITDENGNIRNDLPPITQFLNRVLSLPVDSQNALFSEFEQRLHEQVEMAQSRGELDQGIETVRADHITKLEDRPVYTHESGAETRYVKVKVGRKTKPITWSKLHSKGTVASYVRSQKTGKVMAVMPTGTSETDTRSGRMMRKAKVHHPMGYTYSFVEKMENEDYYDQLDEAEAKAAWDSEVKEVPEFQETEEHYLTGVLLPIWDRIPGENARVMRMLTDDGETILGRQIPADQVRSTLRNLGISMEAPRLSAAQAAEHVFDRNAELVLANGWRVQRRLVGGENRIELVGPSFVHHGELDAAGVFWERIQAKTRYFIPINRAADVLDDVLDGRPIVDVIGKSGSEAAPQTTIQQAAAKARKELGDAVKDFGREVGEQGIGMNPMANPKLVAAAARLTYRLAKVGILETAVVMEAVAKELGRVAAEQLRPLIESQLAFYRKRDAVPVPPEPAPEPEPTPAPQPSGDTTGTKNRKTDEMRAKIGMGERPPVAEESAEQWQEEARRIISEDPSRPLKLAEDAAVKPWNLSPLEEAILQQHIRDLENRRLAGEDVYDEYVTAIDASEKVGTLWGRSGVSRQVELRSDFSFEGIIRQHMRAVNERPSDEQMAKYEELADKLRQREAELDEEVKRAVEEEVERRIAEMRLEKPEKPKKGTKREKLERKAKDAVANFKAKWAELWQMGAVYDPKAQTDKWIETVKAAAEVVSAYTQLGVNSFVGLMARAKQDFGDINADQERALREAWQASRKESPMPDDAGPNEIGAMARKLFKEVVESGVRGRDNVVDAVQEALADVGVELSRYETMQAMSGYGEFRELSKDEIDVIVRGYRGEIQQVMKLEDMQSGAAPKKTGVERRDPTDEERRLIKLVNEAKKRGGYAVTDPERQLATALSAAKTALRNRITDLNQEITTREKIVKDRTELTPDAELLDLRRQRDELLEQHRKIFPPQKKGISEAQRLKMAENLLDRQIKQMEYDLAAGNLNGKQKPAQRTSPALEVKRNRLKELKAIREKAREASPAYQAKKAAEETARYKKSLDKRLAFWQNRLTEAQAGKLPSKRKVKAWNDQSILEKKYQIELVKRHTRAEIEEVERASRGKLGKLLGFGGDLLDLSRAIMTGYEMSAVLRQGAMYTLGFPRQAFPAIWRSAQAAFSRRADFAIHDDLMQRPNHIDYVRGGLETTADDGPLSTREEMLRSRIATWLARTEGWGWAAPRWAAEGLLGSERAFRSFLNTMRADLFDYMKAGVEASRPGTWSEEDAKLIGNASNVFGGRTKMRNAVAWSRVFFAPRWLWSRVQLMAGQPLWKGDKATRLAVGKVYVRAALGMAAATALRHVLYSLLAGDDEERKPSYELDLRSSDLVKMRLGETRLDAGTGVSQIVVLAARLVTGQTKRGTGEIVPIRGDDVPHGADDTRDIIQRFLNTKLAPMPSAVLDFIAGENVVGDKATAGRVVGDRTTPMTWRDIWDAEKELNVPQGTVAALEAFFGQGVSTYGPRSKYRDASPAERQEIFEKDLERMEPGAKDAAYDELLTDEQKEQWGDRSEERSRQAVYAAAVAPPVRKIGQSDKKYQDAVKRREAALERFQRLSLSHAEAQQMLMDYYIQQHGDLTESYSTRARALAELYGTTWEAWAGPPENPRQEYEVWRAGRQEQWAEWMRALNQ